VENSGIFNIMEPQYISQCRNLPSCILYSYSYHSNHKSYQINPTNATAVYRRIALHQPIREWICHVFNCGGPRLGQPIVPLTAGCWYQCSPITNCIGTVRPAGSPFTKRTKTQIREPRWTNRKPVLELPHNDNII